MRHKELSVLFVGQNPQETVLCFSDADECIFVKTMSHIRQAEKTLSIESAFNYSDLNGVLLFKLNRGFHTVS